MDPGIAAVIVASISTVGAVVVAMIQSLKKHVREGINENRVDHATVQAQIRMVYRTMRGIERKFDKHIFDHERGLFDGEVTQGD